MPTIAEIKARRSNARESARLSILRRDTIDADEVARVLALPQRQSVTSDLIEYLSAHLCADPAQRLREPQAAALRELYECRGAFAPMRVGAGKTLVTLLAPTLLEAQRPVLIVPASLRDKTRRDFASYHRAGWRVRLPKLLSYELLGQPKHAARLLLERPDLLILDEAHKARNVDAAVTRRIGRAIKALESINERPAVAVLSGTLITPQFLDYWHLLRWALGDAAPAPRSQAEAQRWGQALDRDVGTLRRLDAGALANLPGGFHEFLRSRRGVIPTPGSDCDAAIEIAKWAPAMPESLAVLIDQVSSSGMRPDGELLEDFELPDCLCQLAQGFFYVWDPLPPKWWLKPRRGWAAWLRAVLDEHLDGFDSPSEVVRALDNPRAPAQPPTANEGRWLLAKWREVRDRFVPNPKPIWVDDAPLRQAIARVEPGTIMWTRHRAAGERLQSLGVPYYGGGANPEQAPAGKTIACSIAAHATGKNLQSRSRNLVLTPPANAPQWEQLIGRTHRAGQRSDVVSIEVLATLDYHHDVLARVLSEAKATTTASGFDQKLTDATWINA